MSLSSKHLLSPTAYPLTASPVKPFPLSSKHLLFPKVYRSNASPLKLIPLSSTYLLSPTAYPVTASPAGRSPLRSIGNLLGSPVVTASSTALRKQAPESPLSLSGSFSFQAFLAMTVPVDHSPALTVLADRSPAAPFSLLGARPSHDSGSFTFSIPSALQKQSITCSPAGHSASACSPDAVNSEPRPNKTQSKNLLAADSPSSDCAAGNSLDSLLSLGVPHPSASKLTLLVPSSKLQDQVPINKKDQQALSGKAKAASAAGLDHSSAGHAAPLATVARGTTPCNLHPSPAHSRTVAANPLSTHKTAPLQAKRRSAQPVTSRPATAQATSKGVAAVSSHVTHKPCSRKTLGKAASSAHSPLATEDVASGVTAEISSASLVNQAPVRRMTRSAAKVNADVAITIVKPVSTTRKAAKRSVCKANNVLTSKTSLTAQAAKAAVPAADDMPPGKKKTAGSAQPANGVRRSTRLAAKSRGTWH